MPPIGDAALYLWQRLLDAGLFADHGTGLAALSWSELRAWRALAGCPLAPWQARALHQASKALVAEHGKAANPDAPAPWTAALQPIDRDAVRDKVRAALGWRAKAHAGPEPAGS